MTPERSAPGPAGPSRALPWAAGIVVALAYLGIHSTFYCFDGVACAIAVELGDYRHLVHGNHLLYGLAGRAFYMLWQAFGYQGQAIIALQTLDSLLGGGAAGVFCALLLDLGLLPATAILATAGLAFSYAWWFWSLEAQVYMLGCLFVAAAAREALSQRPRPAVVGWWHGLAILGHVGHVMFAPAAVYLLLPQTGRGRRRALAAYAAALSASLLTAYGLAALLCVKPGSLQEARTWLLGSAALSLDKSFVWFGGYSWGHVGHWLRMSLRVFSDFDEIAGPARAWAWGLGASAAAAAAWAARRWDRTSKFAVIWLAGYAALYASWQPYTMVYRVSDLLPAWLLISTAAADPGGRPLARLGRSGTPAAATPAAGRWKLWLLACWVAAAGFLNWRLLIEPRTDPARNHAYQEALWACAMTPDNAWIAAFSLDQVYVPYFGHRRPLNIRYYERDTAGLARNLRTLQDRGEPVFVTSETLGRNAWGEFFAGYGLAKVATSPDGITLYEVRTPAKRTPPPDPLKRGAASGRSKPRTPGGG